MNILFDIIVMILWILLLYRLGKVENKLIDIEDKLDGKQGKYDASHLKWDSNGNMTVVGAVIYDPLTTDEEIDKAEAEFDKMVEELDNEK